MAAEEYEDLSKCRLKIISGGQTGADLAALEAAKLLKIKTGGWMPHGFRTEEGPRREYAELYDLKEMRSFISVSLAYVKRSQNNVICSDATVAFKIKDSLGTDKTIGYCTSGTWACVSTNPKYPAARFKPVLVLTNCVLIDADPLSKEYRDDIYAFCQFLLDHKVKVLNVAGHRQTSFDPTWQQRVREFLLVALRTAPFYIKAKLETVLV